MLISTTGPLSQNAAVPREVKSTVLYIGSYQYEQLISGRIDNFCRTDQPFLREVIVKMGALSPASVNWMWTLVFVPVFIGIFKSQIGEIFSDWKIYSGRLYDQDGNPKSADICQLVNEAGQKFICIIERYNFWPTLKYKNGILPYLSFNRGLDIAIVNPGNATMDRKTISFAEWKKMDTRELETEIPPVYIDQLQKLGLICVED